MSSNPVFRHQGGIRPQLGDTMVRLCFFSACSLTEPPNNPIPPRQFPRRRAAQDLIKPQGQQGRVVRHQPVMVSANEHVPPPREIEKLADSLAIFAPL